ncbi:unnamed protein product [Periconia digitata]|uniref:Rhodopsin domain-containing protein n=1 Tax=Periconia digitata TaxID=1303443 RepID=A0A9W4XHE5_9PLEO|nr:unnamed protein product [Periconia digitata]
MEPSTGNRMVNTVVLVFTLFAGLVVALRLFTRGLILRKAGLEDVFITLAMVFAIGLAVTVAVQIMNGMGLHVWEITPEALLISQKAFWGSVWIYNLALTLTKLSILVQYLQIFPNPRFRLNCHIAIGIVALWGTWTLFGNMFICTPVAFFWDKTIPGGFCLNQAAVWFTNGSVNIVQDFIILAMPIVMLRSLDIPTKQKKALIIVFAFGLIVCIISIVRLQTLVAISNSDDPTYDNLAAAMLSAIEVNVGIVCACLPSMRPLFSAIMPAYFPNPTTNGRRTYDEERTKHFRTRSETTLAQPPRAASKGGHSRSGSNSSQFRTPPMSAKSFHSSSPGSSRPYTPQSAKYTHSRSGSAHSSRAQSPRPTQLRSPPLDPRNYIERSYHARTISEPVSIRGPHHLNSNVASNNTSRSHSRNGSQPTLDMYNQHSHHHHHPWTAGSGAASPISQTSTASVHHQHMLHPLRLQPAMPGIPKLPRLPEDMAAFDDPFKGGVRSPVGGSSQQPSPRRIVFHKPLPITPYPILIS